MLLEFQTADGQTARSHSFSAAAQLVEAPSWAGWPITEALGVVRVSVSVPGTQVAPNLLVWMGFDLDELPVEAVAVVPHLNDPEDDEEEDEDEDD